MEPDQQGQDYPTWLVLFLEGEELHILVNMEVSGVGLSLLSAAGQAIVASTWVRTPVLWAHDEEEVLSHGRGSRQEQV